jgi:nicotinamide-nucleotide amidase
MARGRNPSCGSYPGTAHIRLVFEATDTAEAAAAALLDADVAEVRRRLAHHVVTEGDEDLPGVVASLLLASGRTLAVAESLTGGRVSDLLVATPGISRCFLAGFATYANQAKIDVLGVSPATLQAHGAVSEECAREMAEGARRVAGSDLALSTTGIAGPTGATPDKPVGTVFIALATGAATTVRHLRIPGDRPQVRERAAAAALDLLRRYLTG